MLGPLEVRRDGELLAVPGGKTAELLVYLAPSLVGAGQGMFALPPLTRLADKIALRFHEVTPVGADLRILARTQPKEPT